MENTVTFNNYITVYHVDHLIEPVDQPSGQPISQPTGQPMGQPIDQPISQPTSQPINQPTGQSVKQHIDYILYNHSNEIKDKINYYVNQYYIHNRHDYIHDNDIYKFIDEKINTIKNGKEDEEELFNYSIRNQEFVFLEEQLDESQYCEEDEDGDDDDESSKKLIKLNE